MPVKIGKPMGIPRTPGAHATLRAYNSRQRALNCFVAAMRHLQDLGAAPQATKNREVEFEKLVKLLWTTRLTRLRQEYGRDDTDEVVKLIEKA